MYYENWVKSSMSDNCLKFQELWELIMVRSTSEAKCETVGSIMLQNTGKNRHLEPENFNKELFLRVSLGPMHILKGLVNEVLMTAAKIMPELDLKSVDLLAKMPTRV